MNAPQIPSRVKVSKPPKLDNSILTLPNVFPRLRLQENYLKEKVFSASDDLTMIHGGSRLSKRPQMNSHLNDTGTQLPLNLQACLNPTLTFSDIFLRDGDPTRFVHYAHRG